jgi:hypothetical protein
MARLAIIAIGLITFAVLLANCGTDHAQARFVHASPDTGPQDVLVDGKSVVTALAFGSVSPATGYLTVTAGTRRVETRDTGTTTDVINASVGFGSGKAYTVIVSGLNASIAAILLTDDHGAPPSGDFKLRVAHVAPDLSSSLDFYIVPAGTDITGISPTVAGLGYGQASAYQSMTAGSTDVIVTTAGTKSTVLPAQNFNLTAGQNRTLLLIDDGSPTTPSLLELSDLN